MKFRFLLIFLVSLFFFACKPTEKGYQAAYDAALGKRQAAMADIDVKLADGEFQSVDGPQLKEVDGTKVYVLNRLIRPADNSKALPGAYNVAVGTFKMITNSKSQSEALNQEGFDSFPAKDSEDIYYTIAGSFDTLQEAVKFTEKFKSGKNRSYVGLPGAPVIIYSPK